MFNTHKFTIIISLLILLCSIGKAQSRPGHEWTQPKDPCANNDEAVEICQRCAKRTKSPVVYPMCCNNEDQVFNWCEKYMSFGNKNS